jgi:hypothetical protein
MKIYVDTQQAFCYFLDHLVPYEPDEDTLEEVHEWFDVWIEWLVGAPCLDGNGINYEYPLSEAAKYRLNQFGIEFEVR